MADTRRTNFNTAGLARGLTDANGVVLNSLNHGQIEELLHTADAAGCKLTLAGAGAYDQWVLAPSHAGGNTLTIRASRPGTLQAGEGTNPLKSIVVTQSSDTVSASFSTGALTLNLANSTGANNTLTLVKAALDAVSLASGTVFETFITGTASTQMGTSTQAFTVTAPGVQGQVGTGCLLSTQAGTGVYTVTPN